MNNTQSVRYFWLKLTPVAFRPTLQESSLDSATPDIQLNIDWAIWAEQPP
ncbi:hypothetical protein ACWATR_29805 [Nostoc sp. UIC 10890]